jgi:multimeric flavodoxin WrbA
MGGTLQRFYLAAQRHPRVQTDPMKQLLIVNGSVRGDTGNTTHLLNLAAKAARERDVDVQELTLAGYDGTIEALVERARKADGFIFGTGVYWNAHGSPLQHFIEVMTACESTDTFLGKPASVIVTMDSVGGTDVAARLLGVLNLWGCSIPPLSTVVISRVSLLAQTVIEDADTWIPDDVKTLARNVCVAMQASQPAWEAWPVRTTPSLTGAYPPLPPLQADHPKWPQSWWTGLPGGT